MFAAPYPSATSGLETSHTILDTNSIPDDDDHDDGDDDYDDNDDNDCYDDDDDIDDVFDIYNDDDDSFEMCVCLSSACHKKKTYKILIFKVFIQKLVFNGGK